MNSVVTRVLAVESEPAARDFLAISLANANFEVETVATAGEALLVVKESLPEATLINLALPDMPGLHLVRLLRENLRTAALPIVMLLSSNEEMDGYFNFDIDVDDFITKPFNPGELVTRIRTLLRRRAPQHGGDIMAFGGVVLDSVEVTVTVDDIEYHLSPIEFKLLRLLLCQPRRVFTRGQLIDLVWRTHHHVSARTVDVSMRRLRNAIGPRGYDLLETVRGVGYRLSDKKRT